MFMAEKLIITEEVKKQNNMAFKMRSGNKVSFKNMGSSPAKDMKTGSYEHSFESPAKQGYDPTPTKEEQAKKMMERIEKNPHEDKGKGYTPISKEKMRPSELERGEDPHKDKGKGYNPTPKKYGPKKPPTKQRLNKGGEGQDQDKIFNSKGEHIGDYVNDKPVMKPGFKRPVVKKDAPVKPKEGDYEKYSDLEKYDDDRPVSPNKQAKQKGLGPRTAFGGVKNPELVKTKKTKGKKAMIDGPKTNVTGVKNPGNWQPHPNTFKAKKSTVSKHGQLDDAEIEYQNDLKLLKKMNSGKKKKSPAKQAVQLESDSANPGGVHASKSLLGKNKIKQKSQNNAIERSKGETALQAESTKQSVLSATQRKADRS